MTISTRIWSPLCATALLLSLGLAVCVNQAAGDAAPRGLVAWYRGDDQVDTLRDRLLNWGNSAATIEKRDLASGKQPPRVIRVQMARGTGRILRFDGQSPLSAGVKNWGELTGDRTVIVLCRLHENSGGFLFDGSTNTGMSRVQVHEGTWQIGCQLPPIANAGNQDVPVGPATVGDWQVHGFVFQTGQPSPSVEHFEGEHVRVQAGCPAIRPLSGFVLGGNARGESGLSMDLAELMIISRAISHEEFVQLARQLRDKWGDLEELPAPADPLEDPAVFRTVVRRQGDDDVHSYRIPGIAITRSGTLVSVFDIRHDAAGDLPQNIDVGVMRSTDRGATWSPVQAILDFDQHAPGSRGNGVGDPAILVDSQTGEIFVAGLWSYGDQGWKTSGPGLAPEETGQLVLTRSQDDGLTWSKPMNITRQVKHPEWKLLLQGPGCGIQLKDGMLVFAAQFKAADDSAHSCFIWSSDHGETWQISEPPVKQFPSTSEAQIAQLSDGSLLLSMRNESRIGRRLWSKYSWARSLDQGTWSEPWLNLPDPTCMASLIRHPSGALLFTNPNSNKRRIALTVRVSDDDGQTWSEGRLVDPRMCGYSCLTILDDGDIGLLYECGESSSIETLTFARFTLDWARGKPGAEASQTSRFQLAPIFSDQMVFPAEVPVPVWGRAAPGDQIFVRFGNGSASARTEANGNWSAVLPPQPVNPRPQTLIVEVESNGKRQEHRRTDILVGEVWLAAGQSNMDWPVMKSQEAEEAGLAPIPPEIRLLRRKGIASSSRVYGRRELARLNPDRYFSGRWERAIKSSVDPFSAVGWFFARRLHEELQVPIGIIDVSIGGTPTEAWTPRATLSSHADLNALVASPWLESPAGEIWCQTRAKENLSFAMANRLPIPGDEFGPYHCYRPGFLWEAGVQPLVPFPIKGVLWYQGESNAESAARVRQHEQLFPLLVESWRQAWNSPELPFFYVQLTAINRPFWPEFRDQQRRLLKRIPHSGMAVTIDLGHPTDVHPRSKRPVGERLALLALNQVYHHAQPDSGPLLSSVERTEEALRMKFQHADGLRTVNDRPPVGFEVAGTDGVFHPAQARIENATVVVCSAEVPVPVMARYGWQPFPEPALNLVNGANLPASPFRAELGSVE